MRTEDFERLYGEHARPLHGFLVQRTGDGALAEDLLADTFEKVLRARRGFDWRKGSQKTWLYSIALNLVRDQSRRRAAEGRALERTAGGGEGAHGDRGLDEVDDRDLVGRALDVLSIEEREAVALRFGADLSVPEVARVTGEKLTTVEGRIYGALRKLRGELDTAPAGTGTGTADRPATAAKGRG
jgi:RNA polymerase sigma factor (sigma-70 family)